MCEKEAPESGRPCVHNLYHKVCPGQNEALKSGSINDHRKFSGRPY